MPNLKNRSGTVPLKKRGMRETQPIWHNLTGEKVIETLKTNKKGLSIEEVTRRRKVYGKNKLPEAKKARGIAIFLSQFKSPMIYILIIAGAICLALREFVDMWVILAAVFINTWIGFFQENKAERTFEHLKKIVRHMARVVRDGEEHVIDNEELVPGDIIILEAGDIVPADARLIETHNLEAVEAILTGESASSAKKTEVLEKGAPLADRENMVYFGTNISRGKGKAVVAATGGKTEVGKIAGLIKEARVEETPLQKKIADLAKILAIIIASLCGVLFVSGLATGRPFLEMLLISVAVAVAGIPEGLVIAVTITLAIGMQRMLAKKALIRKLIATETLGSTTVIASDKTGTLTKGKMAIAYVLPENIESKEVLKIGLLCNNAIIENPEEELENWKLSGDTTETALLLGAVQTGLERKEILGNYPRLDEIPFESEKMYMATLHKVRMGAFALPETKAEARYSHVIFVKGAPERVIELCNLDETRKKKIKRDFEDLTKKGLRVLAFAQKEISAEKKKIAEDDLKYLKFMGLIALKDPLRVEAKETIADCELAGIRPIIVTGDHKLTAQAIGQEVGLVKPGVEILEGSDLDKMDDNELKAQLKKNNIFARVEPKHKIRIVDALQEEEEVVAMTGDGVNDAPAIRSADIGIALGSGSEVTKETADIVLLDDNFKTIVEAIKQGRTIFDNIKKIVLFLLSDTFTEFILIGIAILVGLPLPILAAQILWVNIIEDTLPAMALAYEKPKKKILRERARGHKAIILDKEIKFLVFIVGIMNDLILFGLFFWLWRANFDLIYIRTMIFVGLGIGTFFYVFSCKNLKKSIWRYNPFDNWFLNISIIIGWLLFLIPLYIPFFQKILRVVPLKPTDWLILVSLGIINLILIELGKLIFIVGKHK